MTAAIVQALATGDADRGGDGWVSVDELYDYIYDEVRARTTLQTPNRLIEVEVYGAAAAVLDAEHAADRALIALFRAA